MATLTRQAPKAFATTCCATWGKYSSVARSAIGHAFGFAISIVFGLLLLSAVNTAIVDLITIQFLMSRDREIADDISAAQPLGCARVRHGRRHYRADARSSCSSKTWPGLADLYAVGVVGAIATNLGATATDRKLSMKSWERG